MEEKLIIEYLRAKAIAILDIPTDETRERFFVIDNPYDLGELEMALRNSVEMPAMLVESEGGIISGNESANNTDTMNFVFLILDKRNGTEPISNIRNRCKEWGKAVLTGVRKDRVTKIVPGKIVYFELDGAYAPVGPIDVQYYGYQFNIQFIVPITF